MAVLSTERLRLEPFAAAHLEALAALHADPEVMRFIGDGAVMSRQETQAMIIRVGVTWRRRGYSWWSFVERGSGAVIGCGPLTHLEGDETRALELGWRLAPAARGRGYATEAARAILGFAFGPKIRAERVLAAVHPDNAASLAVVARLGLSPIGEETLYGGRCLVFEARPEAR